MNETLWWVALVVLVINLPFGYWREGLRKFSLKWLVAVHAPVPAVIALRVFSGLGFHWVTFPVIVGTYFAGQYCGGLLRRKLRSAK